MLDSVEKELAIADFIECVKIPTISGNGPNDGSYNRCGSWLLQQLQSIGLDAEILPESIPNKPLVVGCWRGSDSSLPGILLNSHYDVVPVLEEHWTVPAFEGFQKEGKIYGRGTQDMKSVCVQYLVATRKLKNIGFVPLRDIYFSYVPDEEKGGAEGMNVLLASNWFAQLNIGLALDEGLASESSNFSVFYGERLPWWVRIKAQGNTGHASRFIEGTGMEQLLGVTNRALQFREAQRLLLHGSSASPGGCSHSIAKKKTLGDVTTLNITMLRAGVQAAGQDVLNVIPVVAEAAFDIRISPHTDPEEISQMLDLWCEECSKSSVGPGVGISWEFANIISRKHAVTSTNDVENPWWALFRNTLQGNYNTEVQTEVFPAATDSRFLRALGLRALGFSPMRNSPILLHEHDEFISIETFLEGCEIYITLIQSLSSAPRFESIEISN